MQRSECLDQDSTKMNEVLFAFAKEVQADVYVMTHTTAPFISKESIKKGIAAVASGEYDVEENYGDDKMALATQNARLDVMNHGITKIMQEYAKDITIRFLTAPKHIIWRQ